MGLFELFDSSDKKKRLSHIKNLVILSMKDGQVTEDELDLIFSIAIRKGISRDEVNRILSRPASISFYPPSAIKERLEQLTDMVMVMMVDGDIDDDEMMFCKTVAEQLGFNHKVIEKIVLDIVENIKQGIARDILFNRLLQQIS